MKLREEVKVGLGIIALFIIALAGVILLNARLGEQKSAVAEATTQYSR